MTSSQTSYLRVDPHGSSSTVLIIGSRYPTLVRAIQKYIEHYGGTVFTNNKTTASVDYLLLFDEYENREAYLERLKKGGKGLHVVSSKLFTKKPSPIDVYFLSPEKTYKSSVLVRKLLTKLYDASSYTPINRRSSIEKKQTNKQEEKNKKFSFGQFIKKTLLLTMSALTITSLPIAAWIVAMGISLYSLSQTKSHFREPEIAMSWVVRADRSYQSADMLYRVISPIISFVSPETDTISQNHMIIVKSGINTARVSIEQFEVFDNFINTIVEKKSNQIAEDVTNVNQALSVINAALSPSEEAIRELKPYKDHYFVKPLWPYYEQIEESSTLLTNAQKFIGQLPDLFAVTTRKRYLVLLQNNFELRPTGGFIGSFALITMENGTIKDINVEDVYEADGQLKGQVNPPDPIKTYLNQPNWFLRDSNWNPDFALSAKQAEWFLQKELDLKVDGVFAIDLYALKNILTAIDGVYVPDYQATVTADDFFYKLQNDTHDEFFPGSNKKRNLLSDLTNALFIKITEQDVESFLKTTRAIEQSLKEKHLLLYTSSADIQQTIEELGWGGRIVSHQQVLGSSDDTVADYVMVVDANLGVNKVNTNIKRELYSTIKHIDDSIARELIIFYKNESKASSDSLYSGTYKNYVRIFIPHESTIESLTDTNGISLLNTATIESYNDKKSVGVYLEVPPESDARIVMEYRLERPPADSFSYQLMVQKQPGTLADPFIFKLSPQAYNYMTKSSLPTIPHLSSLETDQLINVDFKRQVR